MKIYTKKGDDGTTGLFYGGRLGKDAHQIELNGVVDEAQAFLGLCRAECEPGSELDSILVGIESDLWVLMAEVATDMGNRGKLVPGKTMVANAMVLEIERLIDDITQRFDFPREFVVPGQNRISALLDVARTVVRRAERRSVEFSREYSNSLVGPYLNRLSDLVWTLARWQEDTHLTSRSTRESGRTSYESKKPKEENE